MKEEGSYIEIKEVFTEYLKKHQHRKTPERYAILERIFAYEGHFNADILYNIMQESYRVSLATIYNTLELLVDSKLIIKHQLGSQFAQYEKAFGSNTHHHLICTNCGRVKEFSDKPIRLAIQAKTFVHFEMSHYSLYLYGLCSKCKEPKKKSID
ncbi:MAG: Fur family transcriptional regulator [Paludibacter sp.]|jgi:Fur family ferric uptake transcriptional regulator|nr:Fur family transcriptional regulator [Paludibacter sp.]